MIPLWKSEVTASTYPLPVQIFYERRRDAHQFRILLDFESSYPTTPSTSNSASGPNAERPSFE